MTCWSTKKCLYIYALPRQWTVTSNYFSFGLDEMSILIFTNPLIHNQLSSTPKYFLYNFFIFISAISLKYLIFFEERKEKSYYS